MLSIPADFLDGPKVRVGRHLKKTYLLCILDDATRYIVYAAFGWSEGTAALIDGLSMAIRRFGIPERFYSDYVARHIIRVLCPPSICGPARHAHAP